MKRILATGLLLLAGAAWAQATNTPSPIRSRAALTSYLAHASAQSPLNALSPGARKRFIASLRFGSRGVASFDASDLAEELDRHQATRVLAMFGLEAEFPAVHIHRKPLRGDSRETPLERKFDQFYLEQLTEPASASLRASYDDLISREQQPRLLRRAGTHDTALLFRAATSMAWISPERRYLHDARLDFDELARRGYADPERVATMHHLLVIAREFDAANALAIRFPRAGLKPLPPVKVTEPDGNPTVLLIRPGNDVMLHEPVRMTVPLRIIVVAGCHFSEDAARAISHDPRIDGLFHAHAIWLASDSESLSNVAEWNRQFPNQPMHVAWRNDEWKMLSVWAMPTFYIFEHGKLVDRWSGWSGDAGPLQTLRSHLRTDGVLPR